MTEEYMTSAEIRQKIAELKIRLAFQLEFEEELERTLAECQQSDESAEEVMKAGEPKILREIDAAARKARAAARNEKGMPRGWKIVAIAAVLMAVSIGSALAAICGLVDAGVLKFDVQTQGTIFELIDPGKRVVVPEGWKGKHYLTYIPDGYTFASFIDDEVCYIDSNGKRLYFDENIYGDRIRADTEKAIVSYAMVNGVEAMVAEKDGATTVTWSMNGKYFVVYLDEGTEAALRIAASVKPIK